MFKRLHNGSVLQYLCDVLWSLQGRTWSIYDCSSCPFYKSVMFAFLKETLCHLGQFSNQIIHEVLFITQKQRQTVSIKAQCQTILEGFCFNRNSCFDVYISCEKISWIYWMWADIVFWQLFHSVFVKFHPLSININEIFSSPTNPRLNFIE